MSVWADELDAESFVETQESVSSGLHMSAFPPLLIQTSFPWGTREEEAYVQHKWDMLFLVLSLIWQKMSQNMTTLIDSRWQPSALKATCIILASMWLTALNCLWTLKSFSAFPSFCIIQLGMSDAAGCQEVINGTRGTRCKCPLLHIHLQPSAYHCSLTRQHRQQTYCLKCTLSEHSTRSFNQSSWCFILLWVRPFILLSHTPRGGIFSTGSGPVFAVSPHKAPGTPKKLAFLCAAAIICRCNPPLPAVSIFLFQGSTSSPTSSFSFCGGGPCVGEVLHFEKCKTTKNVCYLTHFTPLKQTQAFSFLSLASFAKTINSVHHASIWVVAMQARLHAAEMYGVIWPLSID